MRCLTLNEAGKALDPLVNMNRKQFLKLFGWGAATAVLAPALLLQAKPPIPVVLPPKKLKMQWSVELEQDLLNFHGIDAEQELTAIMSREIQREMDQEILLKLNTEHYALNSRTT